MVRRKTIETLILIGTYISTIFEGAKEKIKYSLINLNKIQCEWNRQFLWNVSESDQKISHRVCFYYLLFFIAFVRNIEQFMYSFLQHRISFVHIQAWKKSKSIVFICFDFRIFLLLSKSNISG